jgi:hypothetical protein
VGTARSQSSGRASHGPVGAFAHPTRAAGKTVVTRPGFTVTIANWKTPPGEPTLIAATQVDRNIKKLSSKFGQNGGVAGLKSGVTANLSCATHKREWMSIRHSLFASFHSSDAKPHRENEILFSPLPVGERSSERSERG